MPIRRRLLLGLGLVAVMLAAVQLAVLAFVVVPGQRQLELAAARHDLARASLTLRHDADDLESITRDYAEWVDTWSYVVERSPAYVEANLSATTVTNLRLDVLAIFDLNGRLVIASGPEKGIEDPPPQALFDKLRTLRSRHADADGAVTLKGVVTTAQDPWLVSLLPILRNDGIGPPAGTLLMGRRIDPGFAEALAERADLPLRFRPLDSPETIAARAKLGAGDGDELLEIVSSETVKSWLFVDDVEQRPAFALEADLPRGLEAQAWRSLLLTTLAYLLCSFVVLAVLAVLLGRTILRPLSTLAGHIREIGRTGDLSLPLQVEGSDEIGALARDFDRLRGELHTAREQLAQLLATSPAVVYGYAAEHPERMTLLTGQVPGLLGGEAGGKTIDLAQWRAQIHAEDLDRAMASHERARSGTPARAEYRVRAADGGWRWVIDDVRPMGEQGDGGTLLVGSWTDITELKDSAAELERLAHAAQAASRAKSLFLATMSHEIRTPLTAMLGFADLLASSALMPGQAQQLGVIRDTGEVLLAIINDALDLSRLEEGKLSIERLPVDLRQLCGDALVTARQLATGKPIELVLDIAPDLPPAIEGDPVRLRQILLNLLSNAVKFTEQGRICLRIVALRSGSGPDTLRLAVSDTGIGIAPADQARLFRTFEQADQTIARRFGGSGLGLSICRELVTLMGGTIGLTSTPGQGSTFTVDVPLVAVDPVHAKVDALEVRPHPGGRILVVDDIITNRLLLKALLEAIGQVPHLVGDGIEAVDLAGREPFDLVLMDMHMPHMDGPAAARRIRAGGGPNSDTPIVALTADVMPDSIEVCRAAGMNDHLAKPIDRRRLAEVIVRWSRHRSGLSRAGAIA